MTKRRRRSTMLCVGLLAAAALLPSCTDVGGKTRKDEPPAMHLPDVRTAVALGTDAHKEHRAIMLQHLETIQAIVAALADEDYQLAQGLTESHLGFFMHRAAMSRQEPQNFPPAYHDLAMTHHEAAEKLADAMPSHDLKKILPEFNNVLKACVACHLEYKIIDRS